MKPDPKAAPLDEYEEKRLREMSLIGFEAGAAQWIEGLLATLDKERALRSTPADRDGYTETNRHDAGSRTECSLVGVHAHSFQGPHVFHEWEPGTQPDARPTGDTASDEHDADRCGPSCSCSCDGCDAHALVSAALAPSTPDDEATQ